MEVRGAGDRDLGVVEIRVEHARSAAPGSASPSCGRSVTSSGSPHDSTTSPSETATACTRCRASTTSPRTTSTTIGSTAAQPNAACQWSGFTVCSAIIDRYPDYELDDVLVVEDPKQLRALGDALRARIVMLLRERAASTTELAAVLETPKGTVGHHLKVLETAGLVRVVRTRKVRALTEKYYGRVATALRAEGRRVDARRAAWRRARRDDAAPGRRRAHRSRATRQGHVRARPRSAHRREQRRRFEQRLNRLVADLQRADDPDGTSHALAYALFRAPTPLPPPQVDDA